MATFETSCAIKAMEASEQATIAEKIRKTEERRRQRQSSFAGNTDPCKIDSLQIRMAKRKQNK